MVTQFHCSPPLIMESYYRLCATRPHTQVDVFGRPPTPRSKTRRVLMGSEYVEVEGKREVKGYNLDVTKMEVRFWVGVCRLDVVLSTRCLNAAALVGDQAYKKALFAAAPWWPGWGISEEQRLIVRRTEKYLLGGVFAAEVMQWAVNKPKPTVRKRNSLLNAGNDTPSSVRSRTL